MPVWFVLPSPMMVNFGVTCHWTTAMRNRSPCEQWTLPLFLITFHLLDTHIHLLYRLENFGKKCLNLLKNSWMSWRKLVILSTAMTVFLCLLLHRVDLLDVIPGNSLLRSEIMAVTANTDHLIVLHHSLH